jgi:hypothetical protein
MARKKKYTDTEIIKEIQKIYKKFNEIPLHDKWENKDYNSYISHATIKLRFGSWNKAMVKAINKSNEKKPKVKVSCKQCNSNFLKYKNQIKKTKNNFCSHSCHATYLNLNKRHGTRRSKLEVWLEEKLPKIYPSLDFHFNLKDTINSELDIYIPKLKLAFELNGIFHYEPIFGKKKLSQTQNNDSRKFQACLEKGIELCIIDVSQLKNFKPDRAKKYLDIICDIIEKAKA